jgi:hypothetical protein
MSGHPAAPAPPATVVKSPVLSVDIGRSVGVVTHDQAAAALISAAAAAAAATARTATAHPVAAKAPDAPAQKRGSLPYATPDPPLPVTGTAPGSTVPIGELDRAAVDAFVAKGILPGA